MVMILIQIFLPFLLFGNMMSRKSNHHNLETFKWEWLDHSQLLRPFYNLPSLNQHEIISKNKNKVIDLSQVWNRKL